MTADVRRGHPRQSVPPSNLSTPSVSPADGDGVDAQVLDVGPGTVDDLTGALVVQLMVNDLGDVRSYVYRSLSSATSAVRRAQARGRAVTVTLCQLDPVTEVEL